MNFNFTFLGQSILRYETPLDIFHAINQTYEQKFNQLEPANKQLEKKLETETDEYKKELYQIDLDEKVYGKANMELVARDRLREIKLWSKFKLEYDDGSFDTKNVNSHQFESLAQIMEHKKNSITPGSSQAEVFNVLSQVDTIDRIKKEKLLANDTKEQLPFGKQSS